MLNRANAGAPLFDDEIDYRRFTELLAWCLMPSHWHLVLWPHADGDLGRFIRRLTQRHTQARHRRLGTLGQGHLYQGRYWAFLVQDDAHLVTVCRYVERNPMRAGLVDAAADWPHGSLTQLRRRGTTRLLDPWPLPRPPGWAAAVDRPEPPRSWRAYAARCSAAPRSAMPAGSRPWPTATGCAQACAPAGGCTRRRGSMESV